MHESTESGGEPDLGEQQPSLRAEGCLRQGRLAMAGGVSPNPSCMLGRHGSFMKQKLNPQCEIMSEIRTMRNTLIHEELIKAYPDKAQ